MYKYPIKPTAKRLSWQISLVTIICVLAVLNGLGGDWINFLASLVLITVGVLCVGRMHYERNAWDKYQAENFSYTEKNQDYARRH